MKLSNTAAPLILALCSTLLCAACTITAGKNDLAGEQDPGLARECRTFETLGTKMKRSTCRTKDEWALLDEQTPTDESGKNEFFRRVMEQSAQSQAPAFDSPAGL